MFNLANSSHIHKTLGAKRGRRGRRKVQEWEVKKKQNIGSVELKTTIKKSPSELNGKIMTTFNDQLTQA